MPIRIDLFEIWKRKELELGRSITNLEVAKATGIHRDTVSRIKNGRAYPNEETAAALCRFFDVPAGPVPFIRWERD